MKKLLIILPKMSMGGMERSCANLLKLSNYAKNFDVTLLVGYIADASLFENLPTNIKIEYLCKDKWNFSGKIKAVFRYVSLRFKYILKNNKYDIAICYSPHHKILSTLARQAAKKLSVIFIHNDLRASRSKRQIRQMKFEKFDRIVCVSNNSKKVFEELFDTYNKNNIFVIRNYIDYKYILEGAKQPLEKDLITSETTFVNVARHQERSKKITRIIETSSLLRNEGYSFKVWLVGVGESTEMYKSKVENSNLQEYIKFIGNTNNPYKYIKNAKALILSSAYEGYGMVLDEARVLEVPFISTNVADASIIANDGYGIICENSTMGVYQAMKEFLDKGYTMSKKFDYVQFNEDITRYLDKLVEE